jgi:hypothetical protein
MYTIIAADSYPKIRITFFVSIVCIFLRLYLSVSFDAASALKTYYCQVVFLGHHF